MIGRWLDQLDVEALYITPGSPWENGYAESFHSRLRDEFLALEEFENLRAARRMTAAWKREYNEHRPHSSLGYMTPAEFSTRWGAARLPNPNSHNTWYRTWGHSSAKNSVPRRVHFVFLLSLRFLADIVLKNRSGDAIPFGEWRHGYSQSCHLLSGRTRPPRKKLL